MKKSKIPEMLRLGLILFAITAVAGILLGIVYENTKDIIAAKKETVNQAAYLSVLGVDEATMTSIEVDESYADVVSEIYEAEGIGYAMKVIGSGYGGDIEIAIGFDSEGTILAIEIVSSSETAGLGQKASEPEFKDQFEGLSTDLELEVTKNTAASDNEIEAISGATITSNAVTEAVNEGIAYYNEFLKGGA